ncbi:ADOP family duplicated permease [Silvibacterium sp.]|uniref:ABC transporter permease n=1 Tax=Silvibacterium sp. TaxID=1964179 RepID=UPI0039E51A59
MLRAFLRRLSGVWRKDNGEFAAEFESHLAMEIEDGVRRGLSEQEARRQALVRHGGFTQTQQAWRDQRGLPWLEILLRDLSHGARRLWRAPGFALAAMTIVALGIGANVALFTLVRAVLLRPLPFADPSKLVAIYGMDEPGEEASGNLVAPGDYYDWRKAAGLENMAIWRVSGFNLAGSAGELPEFADAGAGSASLLPTLGVHTALGRWFTEEEDSGEGRLVTVLTWSLFERRFHGDPSALGSTIRLNTQAYTIVGVLPPDFAYPDTETALWVPFRADTSPKMAANHYGHQAHVVGRLRAGVTGLTANEELTAIQHQIVAQFGGAGPVRKLVETRPMQHDLTKGVREPLLVLMAAVGCLLLIGCLNLANLMVARGAGRRREIAVRAALGSSRLRLCVEQVAESLVLCAAGGVAGMALSVLAVRWLVRHWDGLPRAESVHVDGVVLLFAMGLVMLTGVLSGLVPALAATGGGMTEALKDNARTMSAGAGRTRLLRTMLAAEVGLTVVLLVCAGLLFTSFLRLKGEQIGCVTDNVLTMRFFLRGNAYQQPSQIVALHTALLEKVRALGGVEAAGLTNVVPGDGYYGDTDVWLPGEDETRASQHESPLFRTADPGYFAAMGIPLLRGRSFTGNERLDNHHFLVVNRTFEKMYFGGKDAVGQVVRTSLTQDLETFEIIGVVADTPWELGQPNRPMMWFPILSGDRAVAPDAVLVVRGKTDVTSLALPVQKIVAGLDADLPVTRILTMNQVLGLSTADSQRNAALLGAFAGLSLLLAAVGLYGVLSYVVAQRRGEIGIRMALGARREEVLRLMLVTGLAPALWGLGCGVVASLAVTQALRATLYATTPLDAGVYAGTVAVLLVAAIAACLIPAWRAAKTDPMIALRLE